MIDILFVFINTARMIPNQTFLAITRKRVASLWDQSSKYFSNAASQ